MLDIIDQSRPTFHPDFLYRHKDWRTSVILVSDDATHFHVSLGLLARYSTVFAGAASIPAPEFASIDPITLSFAPTWALYYILMTLRNWQRNDAVGLARRFVTPDVIPQAARIAHILDIPIIAKVMLASQDLDVYIRYAIDHMFVAGEQDRVNRFASRAITKTDISFSLYPLDRYRRAIDLLMLANPAAIDSLAKFYHRRQAALRELRKWWSTGEPVGRVLRSDLPPKIVHTRRCEARYYFGKSFRRQLSPIALLALGELSRAKTTGQRTKCVISIIASQAAGCRGCLDKLEAIFMPALRVFNASFPASP
jgi:hypothetical protein